MGVRDGRSSRTVTGSSATTRPALLGAQDQLGVEEIGAGAALPGERLDRGALHQLHPVGVRHREPEPHAKDRCEPGGDGAARPGPGVARARGPLRADDDRGGLEAHARPVEEVEVVVVDVEEHDGVTSGGEDARADRLAVVGLRAGVHDDLRLAGREIGCEHARGIRRPVLDDEHLEREASLAQAAQDLADGFVEQCSFIVRGHDDRKCGGHGGRLPTS